MEKAGLVAGGARQLWCFLSWRQGLRQRRLTEATTAASQCLVEEEEEDAESVDTRNQKQQRSRRSSGSSGHRRRSRRAHVRRSNNRRWSQRVRGMQATGSVPPIPQGNRKMVNRNAFVRLVKDSRDEEVRDAVLHGRFQGPCGEIDPLKLSDDFDPKYDVPEPQKFAAIAEGIWEAMQFGNVKLARWLIESNAVERYKLWSHLQAAVTEEDGGMPLFKLFTDLYKMPCEEQFLSDALRHQHIDIARAMMELNPTWKISDLDIEFAVWHGGRDFLEFCVKLEAIDLNDEQQFISCFIASCRRDETDALEYLCTINSPHILYEDGQGLCEAIRSKNLEKVKIVVEKGGIPVTSGDSRSIRDCAEKNLVEIAKYLLSHGADPTQPGYRTRDNALVLACEYGSMEMVEFLLDYVDPSDEKNEALVMACEAVKPKIVERVLQDQRVEPDLKSFRTACEHPNALPIVELFLKDGRIDPSGDKMRPLERAISRESINIAHRLLDDERVVAKLHESRALEFACSGDNFELFERILSFPKVDPNFPDGQPMRNALRRNKMNFLMRMLEHPKIDIDARDDDGETSSLTVACQEGNVEIVKLLLDLGADPSVDQSGAAFYAALRNHVDCLKLILGHPKSDPNGGPGRNALATAARRGSTESCLLLLKDPRTDPTLNDFETFHLAVKANEPEIVRRLLQDPRVDPASRNNAAIVHACQWRYKDIFMMLVRDKRVDPGVDRNKLAKISSDLTTTFYMEQLINFASDRCNFAINMNNPYSRVYREHGVPGLRIIIRSKRVQQLVNVINDQNDPNLVQAIDENNAGARRAAAWSLTIMKHPQGLDELFECPLISPTDGHLLTLDNEATLRICALAFGSDLTWSFFSRQEELYGRSMDLLLGLDRT